jgi:glyoxylase-like metal-dependent hydrolase (beta-lactamase superfamily II)
VRALALHPDVVAVTSSLLQVNCVLVRGARELPAGELPTAERGSSEHSEAESFVIDSPVLPEELELLPSVAQQAGFPTPSGLLATHADWDHLLAGLAFPGSPLGLAESSAARLAAEPGAAQRELRAFDEELYLERPRPLVLTDVQSLPVPGRCEIGSRELELHATAGHTADGMAISIPWAGVLVTGDYASAIEIPMLGPGGELDAYLATLERLRTLVAEARHVVCGHGPVQDSAGATQIIEQDLRYLNDLRERGARAELPPGRRSRQARLVHARNVAGLAS